MPAVGYPHDWEAQRHRKSSRERRRLLFTMRMSPLEQEELAGLAKRWDCSTSEAIRLAVSRALASGR